MDLEDEYDKLYRYCYFKVRNREMAEDITQEAYARLLSKDYDAGRGTRLPYLYTIAHNLCVDEFRKKAAVSLDDIEEPAVSDMSDRILDQNVLRAVIASFPTEEQELLILRYVNDIPMTVIGRITGQSRFAVYRRLRKIEKRLKERLKEEGFDG